MGKRKPAQNAAEGGAGNKPFRDLKRLLRSANVDPGRNTKENATPAPPPEEISTDEELFGSAMKDVTRVPWHRPGGEIPPPEIPTFGDGTQEDLRLLREALAGRPSPEIADHPEYIEGWVGLTGKSYLPKLRNGTYSIQAHLDLHGLSPMEARAAVEGFIEEQSRRRACCVKIIHGRGINSPSDRAVLKEHLPKWLTTRRMSRYVVAYASAQARDGGVGAVYVLVRGFQPKFR